jgi:hypothetical protein
VDAFTYVHGYALTYVHGYALTYEYISTNSDLHDNQHGVWVSYGDKYRNVFAYVYGNAFTYRNAHHARVLLY